jgi:hypothetical protein
MLPKMAATEIIVLLDEGIWSITMHRPAVSGKAEKNAWNIFNINANHS